VISRKAHRRAEITSFVSDSSRSRKSVVKSFWSLALFAGTFGLKQYQAPAASRVLLPENVENCQEWSLWRSHFAHPGAAVSSLDVCVAALPPVTFHPSQRGGIDAAAG
jgi:hypothetical protein